MPAVVNRCSIDSTEDYSRYRTLANQIKRGTDKSGRKPGQKIGRLSRVRWWLKQLIPHTDWAIYQSAEHRRRLVIWEAWLGKQTVVLDILLRR